MSFQTIEDYPVTIAAGDSVELPGGNYCLLYSLSGPDTLELTFHQEGQRSAKAKWRANMAWGTGLGRPGNRLLFDKVTVKNNGSVSATAVFYFAWEPVVANLFSGQMTITSGDIDSDTRAGALKNTYDSRLLTGAQDCLDVVVRYASPVATGNAEGITFTVQSGGNEANGFPGAIAVERIQWTTDDASSLYLSDLSETSVAPTPVGITPANMQALQGAAGQIWPASDGAGVRAWADAPAAVTTASLGTSSITRDNGATAEGGNHWFETPLLIRPVTDTYAQRTIWIGNLSAGTMNAYLWIHCKIYPDG